MVRGASSNGGWFRFIFRSLQRQICCSSLPQNIFFLSSPIPKSRDVRRRGKKTTKQKCLHSVSLSSPSRHFPNQSYYLSLHAHAHADGQTDRRTDEQSTLKQKCQSEWERRLLWRGKEAERERERKKWLEKLLPFGHTLCFRSASRGAGGRAAMQAGVFKTKKKPQTQNVIIIINREAILTCYQRRTQIQKRIMFLRMEKKKVDVCELWRQIWYYWNIGASFFVVIIIRLG